MNSHGLPQDSKSCASANFAISARRRKILLCYVAVSYKTKPHISACKKEKHNIQGFLVGTTELESVISCMSSKRSNQLSYAPVDNDTIIFENNLNVK